MNNNITGKNDYNKETNKNIARRILMRAAINASCLLKAARNNLSHRYGRTISRHPPPARRTESGERAALYPQRLWPPDCSSNTDSCAGKESLLAAGVRDVCIRKT